MKRLKAIYEEVFNMDGTVKNCGKDRCIDLILTMKEHYSGTNYGNENTGMMNVKEIQRVYKILNHSIE